MDPRGGFSVLDIPIGLGRLTEGDPLVKSSELVVFTWPGVGGRPMNWWC